jgi:hypothetical protein
MEYAIVLDGECLLHKELADDTQLNEVLRSLFKDLRKLNESDEVEPSGKDIYEVIASMHKKYQYVCIYCFEDIPDLDAEDVRIMFKFICGSGEAFYAVTNASDMFQSFVMNEPVPYNLDMLGDSETVSSKFIDEVIHVMENSFTFLLALN